MISNAAKYRGAVKARLSTGDAAANLPSHVPFVDFCETTTRQRLSPLQTSTTGELSQSLSPNALLAAIPFCLSHPPTGSRDRERGGFIPAPPLPIHHKRLPMSIHTPLGLDGLLVSSPSLTALSPNRTEKRNKRHFHLFISWRKKSWLLISESVTRSASFVLVCFVENKKRG